MERLTIYVKEKEQIELLYQFLQHLDFVVMPESISKKSILRNKEYSIFNSAGIWENRTITQENEGRKHGKEINPLRYKYFD